MFAESPARVPALVPIWYSFSYLLAVNRLVRKELRGTARFEPCLALRVWDRLIAQAEKGDWSTMNRIRVLIANQPRLIRELISATIADQPDIELVGEVGKQ